MANPTEGLVVRDVEEAQVEASRIAKTVKEIAEVVQDYVNSTKDLVDIGVNHDEVKEMFEEFNRIAGELADSVETGSIRHMIYFINDQTVLSNVNLTGA